MHNESVETDNPTSPETPKPGLAVQATWLLIAKTTAFVVSLALPIIFAQTLSPTVFGAYRLALVLTTTVTAILPFGFGMSAFYFLPRLAGTERKQLIFNIIAYHFAAAAVVMAVLTLWPDLVTVALGQDTLRDVAPLVGLVVATSMLGIFLDNVATANQDVVYSAVFIVGAQASRALMLLIAVLLFRSVAALLWAWILQGVLQTIALLWYLHKRFPAFWKHRNLDSFVEQARYVMPFGIMSVVAVAQLQAHNYYLAHYITASQYAVYAIGTAQVPLVGLLRESIGVVMQARMSKLQQIGDLEGMLTLILRAWRTLALVFFPCFGFLFIVSHEFIVTLYSQKYAGSVPVQRINLVLLLASVCTTDAVFRAFDSVRFWLLRLKVASLVVQLVLLSLLIPALGMIGAVAALVIGAVLEAAISSYKMLRLLHFSRRHAMRMVPFGTLALMVAGASGLTFGVLAFLPETAPALRLIIGCAVFGSAYLSLLVATRFLNEEEIAMAKHALTKLPLGRRWNR